MKLFGTVKSYDERKAFGSIVPENGSDELRFESSAIQWGRTTSPSSKQRLSYEVGSNAAGEPRAVNLRSIG